MSAERHVVPVAPPWTWSIAAAVLLGVHWLTDVVAGVLLGWGWFTVVAIGFGGRIMQLGEPAARVGAPVAHERAADEVLTAPRATRP